MSEAVRQYAMEYAKEYAKEYAREYGEEQKEEGFFREKKYVVFIGFKGKVKIDVAAEEANVSLGEFEKSMEEAGYKIPELV